MATKKKSADVPFTGPDPRAVTTSTALIDYVWDKLGKEQAIDLSLLDVTKLLVPFKFALDGNCITTGTFLALYDDTGTYWQVADNGSSPVATRTTTIIFDWGKVRDIRNLILTWRAQRTGGVLTSIGLKIEVSKDMLSWQTIDNSTYTQNGDDYRDVLFSSQSFRYMRWTLTMAGNTVGMKAYFYEMKAYL